MPNPLVPSISNGQYTMSALLANPTRLNRLIARLTADQLILESFYRPAATAVAGGGLLFDVMLKGGLYAARDVEQRAPGAEYPIAVTDLPTDLATPLDFGAKLEFRDEDLDRMDPTVSASKITQLANTLARKIDTLAIAAIDAAHVKHGIEPIEGSDWNSVVTTGPEASLTPNTERPAADIARAALAVAEDELGVAAPNTLVVNPAQLTSVRICYGPETAAVMESVGIATVKASMQCPPGVAYVVSAGQAGVVGFERPLTTEVIPERTRRSTYVQVYAVPAFAVPVPGAVRKITGLAGSGS